MGWAVGYDYQWDRDIGYGVPAICDHPDCTEEIDRGLAYVCGSEPYGEPFGCGLFFCEDHLIIECFDLENYVSVCRRCYEGKDPFDPKPEHPRWVLHKLYDETWETWRDENPDEVERLELYIKHLIEITCKHQNR